MRLISRLPPIPPATPRNLWLLLAMLVVWQNLWLLFSTQESPKLLLFVLLLWWGALTCMEDRFETLRPSPSPYSLVLGSALLLWSLWRSSQIITLDSVVYVLAPLQGLALALLCTPIRRLGEFTQQLLILAFLPIYPMVNSVGPVTRWLESWVSPLTATLAAGWLSTLGLEAVSSGRLVQTPSGGVSVAGACSGIDQVSQVLAIALIFFLAFPLRRARHRWFLLAAAIGSAVAINTLRIALLALIVSVETPLAKGGGWWFHFFHEETGSLIFSGINVFLFGSLYLWVIERELGPPPSPTP
jgi:cyanoexosortase A